MIDCTVLLPSEVERRMPELAPWLHEHLEKYGDRTRDITASLAYAISTDPGRGGLVVLALEGDAIRGCAVVNHTGMAGFIPEHQLVYLAVHKEHRGRGLGKRLLQATLDACPGAMALHVEQDNPARFLYEKLGFKACYVEMRRSPEPRTADLGAVDG